MTFDESPIGFLAVYYDTEHKCYVIGVCGPDENGQSKQWTRFHFKTAKSAGRTLTELLKAGQKYLPTTASTQIDKQDNSHG